MDISQLTKVKSQALDKLQHFISTNDYAKVVTGYLKDLDSQIYQILGISTVTIFSIWLILGKFASVGTADSNKGKKKRKKKKTKKQLSLSAIDDIVNDIDTNLVPEFESFRETFNSGGFAKKDYKKNTKEDPNYQILYFNEILLKRLMELDEIDTLGDDELRLKRKGAIRHIQDYHKQLDSIKKAKS